MFRFLAVIVTQKRQKNSKQYPTIQILDYITKNFEIFKAGFMIFTLRAETTILMSLVLLKEL